MLMTMMMMIVRAANVRGLLDVSLTNSSVDFVRRNFTIIIIHRVYREVYSGSRRLRLRLIRYRLYYTGIFAKKKNV